MLSALIYPHAERELNFRNKKIELDKFIKEKEAWYNDTGLYISLVAVDFSIYTSLHEIKHQSEEELKAKRAEALQNICDLITTDIQF